MNLLREWWQMCQENMLPFISVQTLKSVVCNQFWHCAVKLVMWPSKCIDSPTQTDKISYQMTVYTSVDMGLYHTHKRVC